MPSSSISKHPEVRLLARNSARIFITYASSVFALYIIDNYSTDGTYEEILLFQHINIIRKNNYNKKFGALKWAPYFYLNKKQIMNIIYKCNNSIEESIKTIHFNKNLPEYNNVFITNLKDNNAYIFNGTKFIVANKNEIIDELVTSHIDEIESSVKEYENKIPQNKLKYIHKFLNNINDEDTIYTIEHLKKKYPNYKLYKNNLMKKLIYNYSDPKLLEKIKTLDLINKPEDIINDDD